ncbi:MAG: V-type ATP synthase subunit D [Clostridiales bacterium]|nr:V-type ATP synthase subunit D [Clostridiales bacterium]
MSKKTVVPTKGNLMTMQRSLQQARLGYELMDRKRNILIREMVLLTDKAKSLRGKVEETYRQAYLALQNANITLGISENIAHTVPIENGISIRYRSVMGVEIPSVTLKTNKIELKYGLARTNSQFDIAYIRFNEVKELTIVLAEVENSIYRLADGIKKTQKRANALKNIMIPMFERNVKYISDSLEEKEREEFSRQKVIKNIKLRQNKSK